MFWKLLVVILGHLFLLTGCWDKIEHVCDLEKGSGQDASVSVKDTAPSSDSDTNSSADINPDASTQLEGWDGVGQPCTIDDDCTGYGYEGSKCVKSSILGIVNVPGGYCTACCNEAHKPCSSGVQCIGLDEVYLICAQQCTTDEDCRQNEYYVCRNLVDFGLPGFSETFCLPDNDHSATDTDQEEDNLGCDWPWT